MTDSGTPQRRATTAQEDRDFQHAVKSIREDGRRLFDTATTIKKFDPSIVGDFKRWYSQFVGAVRVTDEDFAAALDYVGSSIPLGAAITQDAVCSNVPTASTVTLPQLRQKLLLAAIREALTPDSAPMRLIKDCTQASGLVLRPNEAPKKQAWALLYDRYHIPDYSTHGDSVKELMAMQFSWPAEITSASYHTFWNEATEKAARCGFYPQDASENSHKQRLTWWHVVAEPEGGNPKWKDLITLALLSVAYLHSTVEEIQAFYHAMVSAVSYHERTHAKQKPRVASIRFAGGQSMEIDEETAAHLRGRLTEGRQNGSASCVPGGVAFGFAAHTSNARPRTPFEGVGGGRAPAPPRPCSRCPPLPSGELVFHSPGAPRCQRPARCTTCHSNEHSVHACFICKGVPKGVRLEAEFLAEITRLHKVHAAGNFD